MAYQPKSYRKFLAGTVTAAAVATAVVPVGASAAAASPVVKIYKAQPVTAYKGQSTKDIVKNINKSVKGKVKVKYKNGKTAWVSVKWANVNFTKAGKKTITGTVAGTKIKAKVDVNVKVDAITYVNKQQDIKVDSGITADELKAKLPAKVKVKLASGKTQLQAATWNISKVDLTKAGVYEAKVHASKAPAKLDRTIKVTVEAVNPEISGVSAINEKTLAVKFNKAVDGVARENFVVTPKDGERQYVQAIKWDEKKQVATLTFFNNLPNNKDYTVEVKVGEEVVKGEFKLAITEAASIVLNDMTIPAGSSTPIDYKVLDANGVDISESTPVTFNTSKESAINGKNITLADGEVAFVQAEVTKKDGSKLLSKQARIVAQGAKAVSLDKYTVAPSGVDFNAKDYKQNTFITEDSSNNFVQIQVKDQYGKVTPSTGVTFESLNKDVALVDRTTGAITPIKPGKVDVRVVVGDVSQVITFEVGAKAVAKTVDIEKSNVQLSLAAPTETLDVVVKDQYGNNFSSNGLTAVSKDTTVATATVKSGKIEITGLKVGVTSVEVKLGDITRSIYVEVKQPGTVASYKLEGFEKELDKFAGNDNKNVTSMSLVVSGYDANGVKAESNVAAKYTVTDKDGKVVDGVVNGNTISSSSSSLKVGETYTLTVKVGSLTIASESFKVVDTEVKPVFKLVKDVITVENSKNLLDDLNGDNKTAFEVSKDGVTYADAKITALKFTSDNSSVVDSSSTAATDTINLKADGKATLLLSEITIDLLGKGEAKDKVVISTSTLLDINVKSFAKEEANAKEAVKTELAKVKDSYEVAKLEDGKEHDDTTKAEAVKALVEKAVDAKTVTVSVEKAKSGEKFVVTLTSKAVNTVKDSKEVTVTVAP
ncbi:Ig-like domain-containing protein [Heyndrickxia sporothermodurans]